MKPDSLARLSIDAVNSLRSFDGQYSWKNLFPSPDACAASSIDDAAADDMMYGTSTLAPARATASSLSWWKICRTPTGAIITGFASSTPTTSVDRSATLNPLKRFGTSAHFLNAARLASSVPRVPASPWT